MNLSKIFFHYLILLFVIQNACAVDFEGSLSIVHVTSYDTTHYNILVQHSLVRIDQQDSRKQPVQSLIIDLNTERITAISPNYKLYTNIRTCCADTIKKKDLHIIKTNNYKYINGYKCFLYRVRNETMNTEMSFWIFDSGLLFFQKAIKLLSCTEDYSHIFFLFSEIETQGGLPVLSVERTMLREEKAKTMITQFSPGKINSNVFRIPEDYKYLRYQAE